MSGLTMPPAAMELATSPGSNASQSSLSDLSLAAFLESMYTLEIAPSDGLTASMLSPEGLLDKTANVAAGEKGLSPDSAQTTSQSQLSPQQQPANSLPMQGPSIPGDFRAEQGEGFAKSAFLQDNLSYSVPSDLRWWDLAWSFPSAEEPESSEDRSESVSVSEEKPGILPAPGNHPQAPMPPLRPADEHQAQAHSCCAYKSISEHEGKSANTVQEDAQEYKFRPHHEASESASMSNASGAASSPAGKVHCVPNPNGPGCTCQCDTGVALLNLKRDLDNAPLQTDGSAKAASTLRFTLSSSREVARQCQCSADCPTCKRDPSKQISASLLISTALQIYARALRILREVLVTDGSRKCSSDGCRCLSSQCECSKSQSGALRGASIVDVQIGGFIPSPINSRKIALYAMKLELYDLERALARVCDTARHSRLACTSASVESIQGLVPKGESALRVNPLDQLVLRKLHQQLSELLHTIENMTS